MPLDAEHQPGGQLRRGLLLAGGRVEQVQHAQAFLVGDEGDRPAVGREREAVDVPGNLRRQVAVRAGREIEAGETLELRLLVGRDVEPLAVGAEAGAAVGDLLRPLGCHERLRAGGHVDEPDVALVDGEVLEHRELRVVGRPVGRAPAAALHLEQHPRRGRVLRVHDVDVAVGPVAAGRAEGHAVALVRPGAEAVLRAPAGREHGDGARRHVEAVDLAELVAALVLGEDDVVGRAARPARAAHAVGEEGELAPRAEREAHLVDLRRVAEARRDQDLALRRVPGGEVRRAELGVATDSLGDLRGDLRQAVGDQIVAGLDDGGLRRRGGARGSLGLRGGGECQRQQDGERRRGQNAGALAHRITLLASRRHGI